mmetsp:Transcript_21496/g.45306  ORF Transcript_21496/g.45306 Transcript_21496/m.45306 type:complete len:771 (+) Transcript_21496:182-2494(+)
MPSDSSSSKGGAAAKSPFFRPSTATSNNGTGPKFFNTPGGTTRRKKKTAAANGGANDNNSNKDNEHKSTVLGCSANLVNAIVGSGIVGLPFAVQEAGFVPGILLVLFAALLTEKSLRLLIETAKHSNVPSYETVAEAAYGKFGFYFVASNMFVMSYGAMLSYLMLVKDCFSSVLGIPEEDVLARRAVLVVISSLVILPLSCQRDMADLAKTSKMNVCFDFLMVLLVVYLAFNKESYESENDYENEYEYDYENDHVLGLDPDHFAAATTITSTINPLWKVRWDTIFIGLGVLSFAFVCQHSAFIIAGSLENPTKERWSSVTKLGVGFAACLALLMGVSGYLGFGSIDGSSEGVAGNVLNSLPQDSAAGKFAKGLLGTTMLFVYPMESFVARHACVVLLFEGRKAHEGDDASVLNRRDRRITLTVVLYLSAVIPAAVFEKLGDILAVTGAIGGSNLSYIGPGIVYLGIHGGRFLELSKQYFGPEMFDDDDDDNNNNKNHNHEAAIGGREESIPLVYRAKGAGDDEEDKPPNGCGFLDFLLSLPKTWLWYLLGMPLWTALASIGKGSLTTYVTEMALKSPHPIRIGNVRFARARVSGGRDYTRVVMLRSPGGSPMKPQKQQPGGSGVSSSFAEGNGDDADQHFGPLRTKLLRADSLPRLSNKNYRMQTTRDGTFIALPATAFSQQPKERAKTILNNGTNDSNSNNNNATNYQSINQKIGAMAVAAAATAEEGEDIAIEDDPQGDPPEVLDFVIAISYVVFGVIAMIVGLVSIF